LVGLAIYLYNASTQVYESGVTVNNVTNGNTAVYTFADEKLFKVRMAKTSTPDLTNSEVK